MQVHSSHLALRFYVQDGWTYEILEPLLEGGGKLVRQESAWGPSHSYYVLSVGSRFKIDELMKVATTVATWNGKDLEGEEMRKYFVEMN